MASGAPEKSAETETISWTWEGAGGEGGIRTPDRLAPMPHFECGAFDHSATSPVAENGSRLPGRGRVLCEDRAIHKAAQARGLTVFAAKIPARSQAGRQAFTRNSACR